MKTVRWIKEGQPIANSATYLGEKRKVVTKYQTDHDPLNGYTKDPIEWHYEYLYEVKTK